MYSMCFPGIGLDYYWKQQAIHKSCRSVTGTVRPLWCMFSVCRTLSFLFSSHYVYEYVLAPKGWFCHRKQTWKMSSCLHTKKAGFGRKILRCPLEFRLPRLLHNTSQNPKYWSTTGQAFTCDFTRRIRLEDCFHDTCECTNISNNLLFFFW